MQVWTLSEAKSTPGSLGKIWSQLDISDARPQLSFSTPFLPPEWWSSLLLCPSWSPLLSRAHRMGQLSLFRRIFCAHKLFGTELCGEEDGRLCSDIYRTSGRTDWPDGRNSLPSAANFLFFTAFHQDVNSLPWTISNLQICIIWWALLTTLFGCPTLRGTWVWLHFAESLQSDIHIFQGREREYTASCDIYVLTFIASECNPV